jgi:class 3 adenylate cyclase
LFTDVEGSTRRWENDANAMRAALAAHDEVLPSAIEAHGGFLFKHTGDGVRRIRLARTDGAPTHRKPIKVSVSPYGRDKGMAGAALGIAWGDPLRGSPTSCVVGLQRVI